MSEEPTTSDLVERGQRLVDAMSPRDFEAIMSFYAPHAVRLGGAGAFEGHGDIRRFYEDWIGAFEDFDFEAEEIRVLGHGVTLAVVVVRGRLPASTGWVQARVCTVLTWADGLIERSRDYDDIDRGRAAAERLAEEWE